jgi:hypothetical protein
MQRLRAQIILPGHRAYSAHTTHPEYSLNKMNRPNAIR